MAKDHLKEHKKPLYYINEDCTLKEVSIDLNIPIGTINSGHRFMNGGRKRRTQKEIRGRIGKKLREVR